MRRSDEDHRFHRGFSVIDHLKLTFVAEKPPPSRVFEQVALMAAEEGAEHFYDESY